MKQKVLIAVIVAMAGVLIAAGIGWLLEYLDERS